MSATCSKPAKDKLETSCSLAVRQVWATRALTTFAVAGLSHRTGQSGQPGQSSKLRQRQWQLAVEHAEAKLGALARNRRTQIPCALVRISRGDIVDLHQKEDLLCEVQRLALMCCKPVGTTCINPARTV